jgi:hypothetical protein
MLGGTTRLDIDTAPVSTLPPRPTPTVKTNSEPGGGVAPVTRPAAR